MIKKLLDKKEKKVEYIELIYDLIFVYIIGRNNLLLHHFTDGFVTPVFFLAYIMSTLAIIQIWNYTTYYVNIYGRHSIRDHIFLFVNMFLLYFIGEGTRTDWQAYNTQYHVAWALILFNIGLQYILELRNNKNDKQRKKQIARMSGILFGEAAVVLLSLLVYRLTEITWVSLAAVLLSMAAVLIFGQRSSTGFVDFSHLSERAMLYVVFTFGEMIIAIASYFDGVFSLRNTYFALMAFLIVVGLFLSYGVVYDHIIDREKETDGLRYTLVHVGLIFVLNNITCALEFMQNEKIALLPKMLFLVGSLVFYYVFLFLISSYAKTSCQLSARFLGGMAALAVSFIALMMMLREQMMANIAVTVFYVFSVFLVLYRAGKRMDGAQQ